MRFFTALSLHPAVTAALQGILGLTLVWWFRRLPVPGYLGLWWLFAVTISAGLSFITYYAPGTSRRRHLLTLGFVHFGLGVLLLVIDWFPAWLLAGALAAVGPAISFLLLPWEATLTFGLKPERRWRLLLTTVAVFGVWSGARGIIFFQLLPPTAWWLPWLVGIFLIGIVSLWWWREYGVSVDRRTGGALAIFMLILAEVSGAAGWLPWGYLASGVAFTVLWYAGWLLLRFYLSPEGISWQRQRPLLLGTGVALASFLMLVRWR